MIRISLKQLIWFAHLIRTDADREGLQGITCFVFQQNNPWVADIILLADQTI